VSTTDDAIHKSLDTYLVQVQPGSTQGQVSGQVTLSAQSHGASADISPAQVANTVPTGFATSFQDRIIEGLAER
jgi:hypothetical protein